MMQTPSNDRVDLRSDTVTLPTPAMYERMSSAPLGDDGLDGDPTAQALEHAMAERLGKAAGLYAPTATMANLLAVLAQVQRQETVLAGAASHLYTAERGAAALTGSFYQPVPDPLGALDLDVLAATLASTKGNLVPRLVCQETTHNNEGGAAPPVAHLTQAFAMAKQAGANVHMDGARLFNAAVALCVPAAEICAAADTVAVCLAKGLSAPMGAVLVGPAETIQRARWLRKLLGGTQRQVGIAAAAGLEALDSMVERLAEDHAQARALAEGLSRIQPLMVRTPQTNIVQIGVAATGLSAAEWVQRLRARQVLVRPWGASLLRLVTHRHTDARAIAHAVAAFASVCAQAPAPH